jgi:hypothetical protein
MNSGQGSLNPNSLRAVIISSWYSGRVNATGGEKFDDKIGIATKK